MKPGERIAKLNTAVDALTLRERLMVLAGVVVVIGGLWEAVLAGPLEARERVAASQIEATRNRLQQLDEAMVLAAAGIGEGMPEQLARLAALEDAVARGAESLRSVTSDLIDPTQMRDVLEALIERQQGLTLVRAGNVEVVQMIERDAAARATDEPMLYRHGLTLELEGSYLDCLAYLAAVEALPWRLYWSALQLTMREYPVNSITIEIHTLSLDEDWIGV